LYTSRPLLSMRLFRLVVVAAYGLLIGCGGSHVNPQTPTSSSTSDAIASNSNGAYPDSTFLKIYSFTHADFLSAAQPFLFTNGKFYGTSFGGQYNCGSVYSLTPDQQFEKFTLHNVYTFKGKTDGCNPSGKLVLSGTTLYLATENGGGTSCFEGCGTVVSMPLGGGSDKVLYAFKGNSDGSGPLLGLTLVAGNLYGTTVLGGSKGGGIVFKVPTAGGSEKILFAFASPGAKGTSAGAFGVIQVGNYLYGTTGAGGGKACSGGCGTVYQLPLDGGSIKTLHVFQGGSDGSGPGGVIAIGQTLYGVTGKGGDTGATCGSGYPGCGTVYKLSTGGGAKTTLLAFKGGSSGGDPSAQLLNVGSKLYGVGFWGGSTKPPCSGECGTIFSLPVSGGSETVLHTFAETDGMFPSARLVAQNGYLYGTTQYGGTINSQCLIGCGVAFKVEE
jgi:uncharacterized repeat protein (TIGR03803 family)